MQVSKFTYKIPRVPELAEAGPCVVNWVFQEADRDIGRRAMDLLGTNPWERGGREN